MVSWARGNLPPFDSELFKMTEIRLAQTLVAILEMNDPFAQPAHFRKINAHFRKMNSAASDQLGPFATLAQSVMDTAAREAWVMAAVDRHC